MSDKDTIAHIEALDAKRAECILARDFAGLEPMIAEDLRYVHSSAVLENKQQYLAKLSSGHYTYRSLTTLQREMRVIGDVVLVNGDARIEVEVGGTAKVVGEGQRRLANGLLAIDAHSTGLIKRSEPHRPRCTRR